MNDEFYWINECISIARNAGNTGAAKSAQAELDQLAASHARLQAELERERKDAERYRWLREQRSRIAVMYSGTDLDGYVDVCIESRKAADAARASTASGEGV